MMVVKVEIHPNGDSSRARIIETLYIGNVSDLADVSDYHVYRNVDPRQQDPRPTPDAIIKRHRRSDGALALVKRCVASLLP